MNLQSPVKENGLKWSWRDEKKKNSFKLTICLSPEVKIKKSASLNRDDTKWKKDEQASHF